MHAGKLECNITLGSYHFLPGARKGAPVCDPVCDLAPLLDLAKILALLLAYAEKTGTLQI